MRRSVVAVLVLGQPSLTTITRPQRGLCGTAGYSRCRPIVGAPDSLVLGELGDLSARPDDSVGGCELALADPGA